MTIRENDRNFMSRILDLENQIAKRDDEIRFLHGMLRDSGARRLRDCCVSALLLLAVFASMFIVFYKWLA